MSIQGMRNSDDIIAEYKDRPENWRMGILMLDPNGDVSLTALTAMMKSESTDDPTFHWFEEEPQTYRMAVNENLDTTETEITVVSGALYLKTGDVLRVEETEELLIVTADPTTDTSVEVARGFAGSTATALTYAGAGVNPNIMLMGSAYEEGSDAPEGRSFDPTDAYNHCQIFRDTFEVTGTDEVTHFRTGDAVKEDKRRCMDRVSLGMERAFIFGKRSKTTHRGKPRRTTNGLISQIPSSNIADPSGGNWNMTELEAYLSGLFVYGSSEKLCLCGNQFLVGINQIVRKNSNYQLSGVTKEYGMNVRRLVMPMGELVLKSHKMFNQIQGGTTTGTAYRALSSWGLIVDGKHIKYRYMPNRDLRYQTAEELTEKGRDGKKAGFIGECGLQLDFGKCHGLIRGLDAGVADS